DVLRNSVPRTVLVRGMNNTLNHAKSTLAAISLLALNTTSALALTVPVAEDTFAKKAPANGSPKLTAINGKAKTLTVKAGQAALVRFNLQDTTNVPAGIVPGNIVSATLRLYICAAKRPGDITVHPVTTSWTEDPGGTPAE